MAFEQRGGHYEEIQLDSTAVVIARQLVKIYDLYGFSPVAIATADIGKRVAYIVDAEQVRTDKETGSGTEIYAGQKVYWHSGINAVNTIKADGIFVGWCKDGASASDEDVLIRFTGRLWETVL